MRLPFKGRDRASAILNPTIEALERSYLRAIEPGIKMQPVKAMLGDGTVTEADTFDPAAVGRFYNRLGMRLAEKAWSCTEVSKSDTEDLHRQFFQAGKQTGKYYIGGYFGIQYHALPYYKVDRRVIEIQKELAKIADEAGQVFGEMSAAADKAVRLELEKRGIAGLAHDELLTRMIGDDRLSEELDASAAAVESKFPRFEEIKSKKAELFSELEGMLMYLYQTSPVSIDHNRQMQGEEGVTTYFDIELVRGKKKDTRQAYVDSASMSEEDAYAIAAELKAVAAALDGTSTQ